MNSISHFALNALLLLDCWQQPDLMKSASQQFVILLKVLPLPLLLVIDKGLSGKLIRTLLDYRLPLAGSVQQTCEQLLHR